MNGRRHLAAALALLLPLASAAAPGQERLPVLLCGLGSAVDVAAAARLDDILATATLVPGDPAACGGPPASLRAVLVSRGTGAVAVLLEGPVMALERLVPWIDAPGDGLVRLEERGRLASFAILLEALLAEYRLTAAAEGRAPDGTELPPAPAPPAARVTRRRTTPPKGPPAAPASAVRIEPAPASPPAPAVTPSPGPAVPPAVPENPAVRAPIRGSGGPRAVDPAAPSSPAFGPEGTVGVRFREGARAAAEYGVGLRLGGAFATVRFQPGTSWSLEGRPLSLSTVGAELGWLHPLWTGEDTRAFGRVAVLAERLLVRQLDVDEGAEHEALDAGGALGLALDRRVAGGWWASLGVEGMWLPTAGEVVLEDDLERPQDWIRVPFNGVGARATLGISWRR